jgi:hypothetical protein
MSQAFVVTTNSNVKQDNIDQRNNELTLRSGFSGTAFPTDAVQGQRCYRTDLLKSYEYNGTTWVEAGSNSTVNNDVINSYGTMTSLYARLNTSLNPDGTLKSNVVANISEWITNASLNPTYVSANSFRVTGDQTGVFTAHRAIMAVLSGTTVYSFVLSSTYDGSAYTTVTLTTSVLTSDLTTVQYGVGQKSAVASGIACTPAGAIVSTDVQSALQEISGRVYSNAWKANTAFSIGDICYPTSNYGYLRVECVTLGTTGSTEPAWTGAGTLVADGSVKWMVDDVRDGALPGDICNPSMIIRPGRIKLMGQLVNRADYPRVWKFATDNNLTVTEASWASSMSGLFSVGDGVTTFRLPELRAEYIRGYDNNRGIDSGRTLGSWQQDAIRNIIGSITNVQTQGNTTTSGAFSFTQTGSGDSSGSSPAGTVALDASKVVPTATENRTRNVAYYFTMKY